MWIWALHFQTVQEDDFVISLFLSTDDNKLTAEHSAALMFSPYLQGDSMLELFVEGLVQWFMLHMDKLL